MKIVWWCAVVLAFFFPASAAAGTVYTLPEAVAYGLEHSPLIQEAQHMVAGAENERKAVRGRFMPSLSTGYSRRLISSISSKGPAEEDYLDQINDTFQVNLSQVLYDGARIFKDYARAQAQKEMYEAQKEMTRIRLVHDIEAGFFRLMKAKADVKAAADTVLRLEAGMEAAEAFFAGQMIPWVQVLEIKSELISAVSDLTFARNKVVKERAGLMSIMNLPLSSRAVFEGGLDHYQSGYVVPFEEIWQKALAARPDLTALEKQKIMARKQAEMAVSQYYPRISLDAGYFNTNRKYDEMGVGFGGPIDRDQSNEYWQAGISVQWALFDGGTAWYTRRRHLDQISALEQKIIHAENTIKTELEQSLLSISEATSRIAAIAEAVQAAQEYYQGEKMRLEKSISTTPAVLDAQARLSRLTADYNNARFDYQLSMTNLNYLLGNLSPVEFNHN